MADERERGVWGSRFLPRGAGDPDGAVGVDEAVAGVLLLLLLVAGDVPAAVVDVEDGYAVLVHQKNQGLVREMRMSVIGRMEARRRLRVSRTHRK